MRTNNIKVKITIPIPVEKPDHNGVVYTKEAVDNAINHLHKNLPIIYKGNEENNEVIIGTITGNSHIVSCDHENQICNITIDGIVFLGGTECVINKIENGKVTDFEIVGFGISK